MTTTNKVCSKDLVDCVISGIQDKKGSDIVVLDLREISTAVCDYFVIAHGDSVTQVEAIARSVVDKSIEHLGEKPWHKEGVENAQWVLVDYVSVVVHVFYKEARDFYQLEQLWADADVIQIESVY